MRVKFWKYHGTGNDFILFDNRSGTIDRADTAWFKQLCDRRFGIGADGVMLLETAPDFDFEMVYYNSDGNPSTMCGNGGRCMVAFAATLGIVKEHYRFLAVDGPHEAFIRQGNVHLRMSDVSTVQQFPDHDEIDTGSPHFVTFVDDIMTVNVNRDGAAIRNRSAYMPKGINVNFLEWHDGALLIRTYERGVEEETLSCGTGVTAAALSAALHQQVSNGVHTQTLQTMGGKLQVQFNRTGPQSFTDIWLIGPATFVFEGEVER